MIKIIGIVLAFYLAGCSAITATPNAVPVVEPSPTPFIMPSPTSVPIQLGPTVTHYHANPQRTGAYDFTAIRTLPEIMWQKQMGFPSSLGSPVYADGVLYVGSQNGRLYAYNAETGEEIWSAVSGRLPASVAVAGDMVIVNDLKDKTNAFLRETGEKVWTAPVNGSGWGAPLIIEETVFVVSERGVYALEARTGETIWEISTGDHRGYVGSPAFADGILCFGTGGKFFALDGATGKELWKLEGETWFYGPAILNSTVFIGNDDGRFYAYDLQTGEERWHTEIKGTGWSAPAIAEGVLYVGNIDQHLYAFNVENGEEVWSFEAADWASSDPLVSDGVVYFGVGNHENREGPRPLYALDALTGEELWQFEGDSRLMTAPALSDGFVYIVSFKGIIYALK